MSKYSIIALAISAALFTACSDDDDDFKPKPDPDPVLSIGYVLNTGNWGGNDASLTLINDSLTVVSKDIYSETNKEALGDVAQDIIKYGSKLYCTVTTSSKLVVMDKNAKLIKTIPFFNGETPTQPRFVEGEGGYVYVSAYDGCITKIDTATLSIVGKEEVGPYPEAISIANGKLYTNISSTAESNGRSQGTSVAVIDLKSFKKTKDITVKLNPYSESEVGEDGNVYFASAGDYTGNPFATIQRINTKDDSVEDLCLGTYFALNGNKLYGIRSEWFFPEMAKAFVYDLTTGKETEFTSMSQFSSVNSIDINPKNGYVFISDAPYGVNTQVSVFDSNGTFIKKFEAGYYTCKIIFE